MPRIISDVYIKENKNIWGKDPTEEFNQRILAVNNMYGWLYEKGILEKVSFEFKDYEDAAYFAVNAKDLVPYRKEMEAAEIESAALAVKHIFDVPYSPCHYSGAIELGWTMSSYRDVDGSVGRSWECGLVKSLDTDGIYEIAKVRDEQGVKAAVRALYAQFDWNLTLPEQEKYNEALEHFNKEAETNIENDYVKEHARELIYCYENGKTLVDFDFWTRYETLCGEKMRYDEYLAVDSLYDGDPHDIKENDTKTISEIKNNLKNYRDSVVVISQDEMDNLADRAQMRMEKQAKEAMNSLDSMIRSSKDRVAGKGNDTIKSIKDQGNKEAER